MIPSPRHPLRLCFAFSSICVSEKEVGVDRPAVKCHIGVTEVWGTSVPQQQGGGHKDARPGKGLSSALSSSCKGSLKHQESSNTWWVWGFFPALPL